MALLARLLLGVACALAAPAAHARSWVMTPDPAVTSHPNLPSVEFSAVDYPANVLGLVDDQHSLSVHFQFLQEPFGGDWFHGIHFDQAALRAWVQIDPPCFTGITELIGLTVEVASGQFVYMDSLLFSEGWGTCAAGVFDGGVVTFEFADFPTQADFYVMREFVDPPPIYLATVSATVEVAALAPTLGSLGVALLAAGFVLATLVAARPTSWPS